MKLSVQIYSLRNAGDFDAQLKLAREAGFDRGDDFCALWHLFDLLPGGAGDWQPRYRYG